MCLSRIGAVLIDLSGTLHVGDQAIPRAIEALLRLRSTGKPLKFLTNTTKESVELLHSRLIHCGFIVDRSEIFTSLLAARRLVESRGIRPMLMLEPEAMADFEGINTSNPNAVVVGLAPSKFSFDGMNEAFNLLLEGAELIAVHMARYYRTSDGLSLGPGPFVKGLEYSSDKKATVVGKPSATFFEMGLGSLDGNIDKANTVMIGDDVTDDVLGAIECGMKAILVKTGKYRAGDENKIPVERRNCVNSFHEAVELIETGVVL